MTRLQAQALLKRFELALLTYHQAGKNWTKAQIEECAICEDDIITALTASDFEKSFIRLAKVMREVTTNPEVAT